MNSELKHKIVRFSIAGVIFALFGAMFLPFFTPILLAALFGFALEPIINKITTKKSGRPLPATLILFVLFFVLIGPAATVCYRVVKKMKAFTNDGIDGSPLIQSIKTTYEHLNGKVNEMAIMAHVDPTTTGDFSELITKAGAAAFNLVTGLISSLPEFTISLFVFTIALYYFLTQSKQIKTEANKLDLLSKNELDQIITIIQRGSYTSLVVNALIGVLQGLIVAIGATIFGYKDFSIVFFSTFIFSFIPVLGTTPVPAVMALISFVSGETGSGIGLVVAALIAGSIDNLVKPILLKAGGDGGELHPVISLLAVMGAVIVYGLPGIFLGPILMQLALQIIPVLFYNEGENV